MTIRKFSQGGGLYNILEANAKWPVPTVGDAATVLHYSDRTAGTVIEVKQVGSAVVVTVQEDTATRTDKNGWSETQRYEYTRNPNGRTWSFKRTKQGQWANVSLNPETKRYNRTGSAGVRFGERNEYFDPTF